MGLTIAVVAHNYVQSCKTIKELIAQEEGEINFQFEGHVNFKDGTTYLAFSEYGCTKGRLTWIDQIIIVDNDIYDIYKIQKGVIDALIPMLKYSQVPAEYKIIDYKSTKNRPLTIAVVGVSYRISCEYVRILAMEQGVHRVKTISYNIAELYNGDRYIAFSGPTAARGSMIDQIILIQDGRWDVRITQEDLIEVLQIRLLYSIVPYNMQIIDYE